MGSTPVDELNAVMSFRKGVVPTGLYVLLVSVKDRMGGSARGGGEVIIFETIWNLRTGNFPLYTCPNENRFSRKSGKGSYC